LAGRMLLADVGPNPFNSDPRHRWPARGFRPETAVRHDIALLQSQLEALRELRASLNGL
jgi:hypothetical protein